VWSSRSIILVVGLSIDNVAVGEHRSGARDDAITLGLEVVSDAAWCAAGRKSSHLAPARRGRRCRGARTAAGGRLGAALLVEAR
jgi:hypothetical protein